MEELGPVDPHEFESVGSILRRLFADAEGQITNNFSPELSLQLDNLIVLDDQVGVEDFR